MTAHLIVDQTPDIGPDETGEAVAACGLVGNLTGYYLPCTAVDCADCGRALDDYDDTPTLSDLAADAEVDALEARLREHDEAGAA